MTTPSALAAESRRLATRTRESMDALAVAADALRVTFTPEQIELFRAYDDAMGEHTTHAGELHVAELARHLPGLGPAILALSGHIWETAPAGFCCEPE